MSSRPQQADLESLLEALGQAGVDFIVVGGAAAVLHGAPVTTQDVDIVHRISAENVEALWTVLENLDARVRDLGGRDLRPSKSALFGDGQLSLTTSQGPLDILCQLHDGRGYQQLIEHCVEVTDGSLRLTVVDLETLIQIKSTTGRARDQMVVPILLALAKQPDEG